MAVYHEVLMCGPKWEFAYHVMSTTIIRRLENKKRSWRGGVEEDNEVTKSALIWSQLWIPEK